MSVRIEIKKKQLVNIHLQDKNKDKNIKRAFIPDLRPHM